MKSYQVESAGHRHKIESNSSSTAAELFVGKIHRNGNGEIQLGQLISVREIPVGFQAFVLTKMILAKLEIESKHCTMKVT